MPLSEWYINMIEKKIKFVTRVSDMVKKLACIGITDWSDDIDGPEDMINLAVGQPDIAPPTEAINELSNSAKEGKNGYQDSQGIEELRVKIADKYIKDRKEDYDVCVTAGTTAALYLSLATCFNAGDEILLVDPYFPQYLELLKINNLTESFIETKDDFLVSLELVKNNISKKTKGIILNYPNNPTGALLDYDELNGIVEYCEAKGIYVLFDNIYSEYVYYDDNNVDSLYMRDNLIYINGFSKSMRVTGWRIGYVIANRELIHYITELQAQLYQCVSAPVQYSVLKSFDADMGAVIEEYRERMNYIQTHLSSDYKRVNSCGGFFVYARIPQYYEGTATDFCILAKKRGVHLVPGKLFSREDTYFRISICVPLKKIIIAVERLNKLVSDLKISTLSRYIEKIVGRVPVLVGSMGIGIDIDDSDIDFAIPFYGEDDEIKLLELLNGKGFEFRGKRISTSITYRYLYSFYWENSFVDLVILNEADFKYLSQGIKEAYLQTSMNEKNKIKEIKKKLSVDSIEKYEEYKLTIYKRFCPQLLWLTDIEICELLVKEYREKEKLTSMPQWLKDKIDEYGICL